MPRATCLDTPVANSATPAEGDTILLASGSAAPAASAFYRSIQLNGVATWVPNRTLVLVFDASNWDVDQTVWVTAVDDKLAEGPRVVTVSHSVIAPADAAYDNVAVRNVEVTVLDNDQAGLEITQLDGAGNPDSSTVVIEGTAVTRQIDSYRLSLAKVPAAGKVVKVQTHRVSRRPAPVLRHRRRVRRRRRLDVDARSSSSAPAQLGRPAS